MTQPSVAVARSLVRQAPQMRPHVLHLDVVEEVRVRGPPEYAEATVQLHALSSRLTLAKGIDFDGLVTEIGRATAAQRRRPSSAR